MNEAALNHAKTALNRAQRSLHRLMSATSLDEAEEAWDHFLHAASRVHEKLRAGAKGSPKSWAWFRLKLDERRDDQLLRYMHHARNSDHHRFEDIVTRHEASISLESSGAGAMTSLIIWPDGRVESDWTPLEAGAQLLLTEQAAHLGAVSVIDAGIVYEVPTTHLGRAIDDTSVVSLGTQTLSYLNGLLAEANNLAP